MALFQDSVTGEQYDIPDGTTPEVAQQIVQRQRFGRRLLSGGAAQALGGMLGDAQAARPPVQPTIAAINGGKVMGLGLEGSLALMNNVQQSNSDVLRAKEERGRQVLQAQENEKQRQAELKWRQEQLRTASAEKKLERDHEKYLEQVREDAKNKAEKQAREEENYKPVKIGEELWQLSKEDGEWRKIAAATPKPKDPLLRTVDGQLMNVDRETMETTALTPPSAKRKETYREKYPRVMPDGTIKYYSGYEVEDPVTGEKTFEYIAELPDKESVKGLTPAAINALADDYRKVDSTMSVDESQARAKAFLEGKEPPPVDPMTAMERALGGVGALYQTISPEQAANALRAKGFRGQDIQSYIDLIPDNTWFGNRFTVPKEWYAATPAQAPGTTPQPSAQNTAPVPAGTNTPAVPPAYQGGKTALDNTPTVGSRYTDRNGVRWVFVIGPDGKLGRQEE